MFREEEVDDCGGMVGYEGVWKIDVAGLMAVVGAVSGILFLAEEYDKAFIPVNLLAQIFPRSDLTLNSLICWEKRIFLCSRAPFCYAYSRYRLLLRCLGSLRLQLRTLI